MTALLFHPIYLNHLTGLGHPERPERCLAILSALAPLNLPILTPRAASKEELSLCHTKAYIDLVEKEARKADTQGNTLLSTGDAMLSPQSFEVARFAAGGCLEAVRWVMEGKGTSVFCLIRPPGHHACSDRGMGFCLFNNAALTARFAQKKFGVKRTLIVDWDVHHGNGTQEIVERDPSIFYFSTHQAAHYPFTGSEEELGIGNILNCPIPGGQGARLSVIKAFETKLKQSQEQFKPELVIISAGFDGHQADPLGYFDLTDGDFGHLTKITKAIADNWAGGRIVSILEGGYRLTSLASSTLAHITELLRG